MGDFIPTSEGNLLAWLNNYAAKITTVGAACGMTEAEIKAQQTLAQDLIAELNNATRALADSKKATAIKNAKKKDNLSSIRGGIAHIKVNPNFTASMGKDLQTESTPNLVDPATYKAFVTGKVNGGAVQLRFKKLGVQAVNIYTKLQGDAEFGFLERIGLSTYTDARPLKTAGMAEARQYLVMGVMADKEIGLPSDILTISYGG